MSRWSHLLIKNTPSQVFRRNGNLALTVLVLRSADSLIHMMTSSNEKFSALLAISAGKSPVPGEFLAQRPVTRSFDAFFDLLLNRQLSKQSWGWWFETPSRPLWRHGNDKQLTPESMGWTVSEVIFAATEPVCYSYCHTHLHIIIRIWL